jgi:hypothetical protein
MIMDLRLSINTVSSVGFNVTQWLKMMEIQDQVPLRRGLGFAELFIPTALHLATVSITRWKLHTVAECLWFWFFIHQFQPPASVVVPTKRAIFSFSPLSLFLLLAPRRSRIYPEVLESRQDRRDRRSKRTIPGHMTTKPDRAVGNSAGCLTGPSVSGYSGSPSS